MDYPSYGVTETGRRFACTVTTVKGRGRKPSKPHSTPATLKWLIENYELSEGVCIPRCTVYSHYVDFCDRNDSQPVNAASFGKIIRQQFPQITTRRLGTRGQSRYHYYGIAVKESSMYYDAIYSRHDTDSNQNETGKKSPASKQQCTLKQKTKPGSLLPDFPSTADIVIPDQLPADKVSTFLMMYRTHCQRIVDTVARANFEEVKSFLVHYWQGMPPHMLSLVGTDTVVSLVCVCDSLTYRTIADVLIPSVLQPLPDSLAQLMCKFANDITNWLEMALHQLPQNLFDVKMCAVKRFTKLLHRYFCLNQLCQTSRSVVNNPDTVYGILVDLRKLDIRDVMSQVVYTIPIKNEERLITKLIEYYKQFEDLLESQATLEDHATWLESLIDQCIMEIRPSRRRRKAKYMTQLWMYFGTKLIRELTLRSSPSFGAFQVLRTMLDDYLLTQLEKVQMQLDCDDMLQQLKGETIPQDPVDPVLSYDAPFISHYSMWDNYDCSTRFTTL